MRTAWVAVFAVASTLWHGLPILAASMLKLRSAKRICWRNPRRWSRSLLWAAGARVEMEGLEHLAGEEPQILVANHESWFDVLALAGHLPVEYRFVAKQELASVPVFGPAWQACGHIGIDREDRQAAIRSLERARREVGHRPLTVVMFPEGTRSATGKLMPFKKGAFVLAIQAGIPIVPAGIEGSREVMAKHGWRIRPGTIRVRFGEPIRVEGMGFRDRDLLAGRAREAVAALRKPAPAG